MKSPSAWARDASLARGVLSAKLLRRRRPLALSWEVTSRCNAACCYCAFRDAAPDELSTAEALRLIDEMHACGTRLLALTGGEPLTRGDLPCLVAALSGHGIELSLNSNGVLVPRREDVVRAMARVQISLDGPEAVHDRVRGSGSWRRAVDAIDACERWGVSVSVQAVLTRTNLPHVHDLMSWCVTRGLRLQVQPASALVLESDAPNAEAPEPRALDRALRTLSGSPQALLNSSAVLAHMRKWPAATPMRCASGEITARIDSVGTLRLCGRPPAAAPAPSCRALGLAEAYRRLRAPACDQCWCAPRVQVNLAYQGRGLVSLAHSRGAGYRR